MSVEERHGENTITKWLSYEGPAETFEASLKEALKSFGAAPTGTEDAKGEKSPEPENDPQ